MDRIAEALSKAGKKAFVPYIMAGDGGLEEFVRRLKFLQENGSDAIEIGIPFSDPVADGPTIQRAGERALNQGITLKKVLETLAGYRNEIYIPLILMTYLNPLVAYGLEKIAKDAKQAGVAGLIIPDLPIEEEEMILPLLEKEEISLIRLVTLTTPSGRIRKIAEKAKGFIYAITVTGITGTRKEFNEELYDFLSEVKTASSIPVLAGFGVSTKEQIEEVCQHCDGVVIGSRIIDLFEKGDYEGIRELIQSAETVNI
ncbi:tryptophan synthase subunit alpha [Bacillus sp. REN3]|uniref:tryptophan synthase subunit alpha n=1 Tax=Bacillus sp. REN3 TaxID=2802440 RepID=UPI001AEE8E49|nr:tryptophan synthase subunit alpha [Bacillus sp. REN3]